MFLLQQLYYDTEMEKAFSGLANYSGLNRKTRRGGVSPPSIELHPAADSNTVRLRIFVGWVERNQTQQTRANVGFRSSTQPTHFYFLALTEPYCG